MSFESKMEHPNREELQIESKEQLPNIEYICEGKGLEEIQRTGFEKFRAALANMSYAEIAGKQLEQIKHMKAAEVSRSTTGAPEWVREELNRRAGDRANELADKLVKDYGKDGSATFVAHGGRGRKKLMVSGRHIERDEQGAPRENLVARVYFSVDSAKAPEAFKSLFE